MSSELLRITTEFTEDSIVNVASPCNRPSCTTTIQPGKKRFYLAPEGRPNDPGRHVCGPCFQYYLDKRSTTACVVPSHTNSGRPPTGRGDVPGSTVNLSVIRTMVNESQRRGSHTPEGRVTAVSQHIAIPIANISHARISAVPAANISHARVSAFPPQVPQNRATHIPTVNNPSFFQNYFANQAPSSTGQTESAGYSAAHLQYQEERKRWSTKAYKTPSGQIPLRAQAKQEVRVLFQLSHQLLSGKVEKVTAIKEGMAVEYDIHPYALADFIKATLLPQLSGLFEGFPWDMSKMAVRETASWQDVLKVDLTSPYFQGRFLKAKPGAKSDGSLAFLPPKNPVEFSLIVNREQWMEAEEYEDNKISSRGPVTLTDKFTSPIKAPDTLSKRKTPPSPEKVRTAMPSVTKKQYIQASHPSILSSESKVEQGTHLSFKHLDADKVRKGIFLGGQEAIIEQKKQFDLKITERVACYLIQSPPFAELCESDNLAKPGTISIINQDEEYIGYLSYDKNKLIGKGTFKTAHLASLNWASQPPARGFGANNTQPIAIALKRPYDDRNSDVIKRFNYADESRKVLTEGTLLGWADSLLEFAYAFIHNFIADKKPAEAPFSIPLLRFVKGAIVYSEKPLNSAPGAPSGTSHRAAYLLEELLPMDHTFIKYIHNADAVPLQSANEPGYNIGLFLCFIQYVQFVNTHGQAYISDFQGAGNLLTDPQVMTDPSLSQQGDYKTNLFGEGNVNTAFEAFTSQHQCNFYCKWFQLEKFTAADES